MIIEKIHSNIECVKAINGSMLYIDTSVYSVIDIEKNDEGEIIAITIQDDLKISRGDQIYVKTGLVNSLYDVKLFLIEVKNQYILIYSDILTQTSIFLVPILNKSMEQLEYKKYFNNAYLSDDHKYMCLIYRNTGTKEFQEFEESIKRFNLFKKQLEYNQFQKIYLFRIPNNFMEDINFFWNGQYSLFSDKLKKLIIKFYGKNSESRMSHILRKTPELKQVIENELNLRLDDSAELASIPNIEEEILPINLSS